MAAAPQPPPRPARPRPKAGPAPSATPLANGVAEADPQPRLTANKDGTEEATNQEEAAAWVGPEGRGSKVKVSLGGGSGVAVNEGLSGGRPRPAAANEDTGGAGGSSANGKGDAKGAVNQSAGLVAMSSAVTNEELEGPGRVAETILESEVGVEAAANQRAGDSGWGTAAAANEDAEVTVRSANEDVGPTLMSAAAMLESVAANEEPQSRRRLSAAILGSVAADQEPGGQKGSVAANGEAAMAADGKPDPRHTYSVAILEPMAANREPAAAILGSPAANRRSAAANEEPDPDPTPSAAILRSTAANMGSAAAILETTLANRDPAAATSEPMVADQESRVPNEQPDPDPTSSAATLEASPAPPHWGSPGGRSLGAAIGSVGGSQGSLGPGGGELDSVSLLSGTSSLGGSLADDLSSLGSDSELGIPPFRRTDRFGFLGGSQYSHAQAGAVPAEVWRQREQKWLEMFSHWDKWVLRRYQKLKLRCRKGIPSSLRGRAWQLLCDSQALLQAHPGLFQRLDQQPGEQHWLDVIHRDLHRQFPFHEMFAARGGHGQQELFRVLKAYTVLRPEEGYCQAQAPVAAVLLMQMPAEQAFWCLVQICDHYLPGYYSAGLEAIQLEAEAFGALLRRLAPGVWRRLRSQRLEPVLYLPEWFLCLYSRSLPWPHVLRVWDMFFCEGSRVLFRVGLVLLRAALGGSGRSQGGCQSLDETMERLRAGPPPELTEDALVSQVCSVPLSEALLGRARGAELRRWRELRGGLQREPLPPLQGARQVRQHRGKPPRTPTPQNPPPKAEGGEEEGQGEAQSPPPGKAAGKGRGRGLLGKLRRGGGKGEGGGEGEGRGEGKGQQRQKEDPRPTPEEGQTESPREPPMDCRMETAEGIREPAQPRPCSD